MSLPPAQTFKQASLPQGEPQTEEQLCCGRLSRESAALALALLDVKLSETLDQATIVLDLFGDNLFAVL